MQQFAGRTTVDIGCSIIAEILATEAALLLGHPVAFKWWNIGFDAVILDWMVPAGMDGFKTMERLLALDPNAKGILSSGYPEQDSDARTAAGFADVIGKPYEIKTLRETLERVLGTSLASN